jgi:hypothetical protein
MTPADMGVGYIVPEVLRSLGDGLAVKADYDTAHLLIAMGDVEVDLSHPSACIVNATNTRRTLWVILGPFVASEACAKKTKATERINRKEMTNL